LVGSLFFPPPVLPGSGLKGRQQLSRPLSQVTNSQLPDNLESNMLFSRIIVSYHGSVANMQVTIDVKGDLEVKTYDVDFAPEVRD
jgi:hypothetical protein